MRRKISFYLIMAGFILFVGAGAAFAQQALATPREEAMLFAMDNLQVGKGRDDAMRQAMLDAQLKTVETTKTTAASPLRFQGESLGKFLSQRSHPYLSFGINYDRNVATDLSSNTDITLPASATGQKFGDWEYTPTAGLKMNFVGRDKALNLDTRLFGTYYGNYTRLNELDVSTGFASYINIGKYILSAFETYNNNYIAKTEELGAYTDDLMYRWANTFSTTLGRYFNRVGFDVGYTRQDQEYEPEYSYDNDMFSNKFNLNSYLRIATKTRLQFGYSYLMEEWRHSGDKENTTDFNLALTGLLSPKLTYSGRVDYNLVNSNNQNSHSNSNQNQSNLNNNNSSNNTGNSKDLSFGGGIGYNLSTRTNFSCNYTHTIYRPSNSENNPDSLSISGNHRLAFNPKFNISGSYYYNFSDYGIGFGLSYAFRKWLDFGLNFADTWDVGDRDHFNIGFHTNARF